MLDRNSCRALRLAAALTTVATALAAMPAAAATTKPEGSVGAWKVLSIFDAPGKLSRCAGDLNSPSGTLRLAWFAKTHDYFISWPSWNGGVAPASPAGLRFDGYRAGGMANQNTRASIKLSSKAVEALMASRNAVVIEHGKVTRTWPLNHVDMTDVFVAVENCVHKYER